MAKKKKDKQTSRAGDDRDSGRGTGASDRELGKPPSQPIESPVATQDDDRDTCGDSGIAAPGPEFFEEEDMTESIGARGRIMPEMQSFEESFAASSPIDPEDLVEAWTLEYGDIPQLERIFGVDDRVRIRNTTTYPYSCVCSLRMTPRVGQTQFIGTGWFAGPRLIVTAGHNLYMHKKGGWVRKVEVFPGRDANHKPISFSVSTKHLRSTNAWVKNRVPEHDYGAIILKEPIGDRVGYLGVARMTDPELTGLTVNLVGYPGDKKHPSGAMWGHANRLLSARRLTLVYKNDTYPGNSGGPVIEWDDDGNYYSVGIHNYGGSSGNTATRITSDVLANIRTWKK